MIARVGFASALAALLAIVLVAGGTGRGSVDIVALALGLIAIVVISVCGIFVIGLMADDEHKNTVELARVQLASRSRKPTLARDEILGRSALR